MKILKIFLLLILYSNYTSKILKNKFKKIQRLHQQIRLLKIVYDIKKKSLKKHYKIKSILVGKNVKKQLNIKTNQQFKRLLSKKHILKKIHKLQRKIKKLNKKQRKLPDLPGQEEPENDSFQFKPNFAGMPYPPFLLNGPHYHPPMNIQINTLPFPNPRAENFYPIAQDNAKEMSTTYNSINKGILDVKNELSNSSGKIQNDLNQVYFKFLSSKFED